MSIPKEPRQLMITIMYLVLTAMLALNVSAEVFNAFKLVDESLMQSNRQLTEENRALPNRISELAQRDPETYQVYVDLAPDVRQYADDLVDYLEGIIEDLIEDSGGWHEVNGERRLVNDKHTEAANRVLVNRDLVTGEPGEGARLLDRMLQAEEDFLEFIPEADLERHGFTGVAISMNPDAWKDADSPRESWEDFMFSRMPLQAVLPIFRKYINDVRLTENNILNYYLQRIGGEDVVFDQFHVVASPSSSYVIRGETYEADIFLSAASSALPDMEVLINGNPIQIQDGIGQFSTRAQTVGINQYNATIRFSNPVTGEVSEYTNTFQYEVGLRSANVAAEKMNVFYIGVDNPVSISAAGIPTAQLNVDAQGAGISLTPIEGTGNRYNVRVEQPGDASIILSGGGLERTSFDFRVRRIPDPVAKFSGEVGGALGDGQFRAQRGVIASLENFDFDARCEIAGFRLVRIERRQDPQIADNVGGSFGAEAQRLVDQASPGDRFFFENVRARCPGDSATRRINDMGFTIR
jgi:gliding motility-associated protein GldM